MKWIKKLPFFFLIIITLLIPFKTRLIGPAIILWVVSSLIVGDYKQYKNRFIQNKAYYLPLILFYVWHMVGMLWTENMVFGLKDLEYKMSFLIIPLVLPLYLYTKKEVQTVFSSFVLVNLVVAIVCIGNSLLGCFVYDKINSLNFGTYHVLFIHRSYYSFYLIISLWFLWAYRSKTSLLLSFMNNIWFKSIVSLFMLSSIVMGQSKAGIISIVILFVLVVFRYRKSITKKILLITGALLFVFSALFGEVIIARFKPMLETVKDTKEINVNKPGSTGARIELYTSAVQLIKKSPFFGYGTGDIKDVVKQQNQENGFIGAVRKNYNTHNQFLNTWVAIGIVGVLLLLSMFIFPFINAYQHQNIFSIGFLIILFFNCLPEAWMEQQAGIVSSVLFICLLPFTNK